eukprot:COSAG01_NODE_450_length_16901_cov_7.565476_10_plen_72_part_00
MWEPSRCQKGELGIKRRAAVTALTQAVAVQLVPIDATGRKRIAVGVPLPDGLPKKKKKRLNARVNCSAALV